MNRNAKFPYAIFEISNEFVLRRCINIQVNPLGISKKECPVKYSGKPNTKISSIGPAASTKGAGYGIFSDSSNLGLKKILQFGDNV